MKWNGCGHPDAVSTLLRCCASKRWADGVASLRPYAGIEEVVCSAHHHWDALSDQEWLELFETHDRLAELAEADMSQDSRHEQRALSQGPAAQLARFVEASDAYERRFGFMFIALAYGRTVDSLLAEVESRSLNSLDVEVKCARREHRRIAERRLRLALGPPRAAPRR